MPPPIAPALRACARCVSVLVRPGTLDGAGRFWCWRCRRLDRDCLYIEPTREGLWFSHLNSLPPAPLRTVLRQLKAQMAGESLARARAIAADMAEQDRSTAAADTDYASHACRDCGEQHPDPWDEPL